MNQTPIYVKIEYEEALNSKRSLLSLQRNLLKSLKFMNQYFFLRFNELKTKTKLHSKIKDTLTEIKKVEKNLPNAKIPEILKKEDEEEYQFGKKLQKNKEKYNKDIESQLAEIQEKLRNLQ